MQNYHVLILKITTRFRKMGTTHLDFDLSQDIWGSLRVTPGVDVRLKTVISKYAITHIMSRFDVLFQNMYSCYYNSLSSMCCNMCNAYPTWCRSVEHSCIILQWWIYFTMCSNHVIYTDGRAPPDEIITIEKPMFLSWTTFVLLACLVALGICFCTFFIVFNVIKRDHKYVE